MGGVDYYQVGFHIEDIYTEEGYLVEMNSRCETTYISGEYRGTVKLLHGTAPIVRVNLRWVLEDV